MAKRASGGVNKSQEIRKVFEANPDMSAKEVIETLKGKGVDVKPGLVYLIKGKLSGRKRRRRRKARQVAAVAARVSSNSDVLGTIKKIKSLADDVGGIRKLKELVEVLAG